MKMNLLMGKVLLFFATCIPVMAIAQNEYDKIMTKLERDPSNGSALWALGKLTEKPEYDTEIIHYTIASGYINGGKSFAHEARVHIDKAIAFDSTNVDYRWMRVLTCMTSMADEEDFLLAMKDMTYISEVKGETATLNANMGLAMQEYGGLIKRGAKPTQKNTFLDNDPEYEEKKQQYCKDVLESYRQALTYYKKAMEMNEEYEGLKYDIKNLESEISEMEFNCKI